MRGVTRVLNRVNAYDFVHSVHHFGKSLGRHGTLGR